jgi:hypothetical protein
MYESFRGTGDLKSVIRQGAGVVKPHKLLNVEDYVSPSKQDQTQSRFRKNILPSSIKAKLQRDTSSRLCSETFPNAK